MMGNDGYLCLLRFIFPVAFLHSCILDMNLLPQLPEPECNQPPVTSVEEEETEDARPRRKAAIAADRFRAELYKRYTI